MKVSKNLALCAAISMMPLAAYAVSGDYSRVTDDRLKNPEASNWLMYRGNYSSWGYSPLSQINDKNVENLELAWAYTTGQKEGHQAPPVVNNGYMYITTPGNRVVALDAKTGAEIWSYKKQLPEDLMQLHPTNRGVALYDDKVYMATVDCHVVALDAVTGREVFSESVCDSSALEYMTLAPLAVEHKILVGVSGGETGVRGSIIAVDSETGEKVWQTYTVPAPGKEVKPGQTVMPTRTVVVVSGLQVPTILIQRSLTGEPVIRHPGLPKAVRATTFIQLLRLR